MYRRCQRFRWSDTALMHVDFVSSRTKLFVVHECIWIKIQIESICRKTKWCQIHISKNNYDTPPARPCSWWFFSPPHSIFVICIASHRISCSELCAVYSGHTHMAYMARQSALLRLFPLDAAVCRNGFLALRWLRSWRICIFLGGFALPTRRMHFR